MVKVETEVIIHRAIELVSSYASNPDNAPEWYKNIQSADWVTSNTLQIGSRVAFIAYFLGRKLAYTYEIAEYIPLQKLVMRTFQGPFPMETTYTFSKIDEQTTKMTLQNKGEPSGFSRLFGPFMARMMKKANTKDLENLKKILESKS